jgi:hypothetical protein
MLTGDERRGEVCAISAVCALSPLPQLWCFRSAGEVCAISAICALSPRVGFCVDGLGFDSGPKGRVASSAGLGVTVNQSQAA